MPTCPSCDNRFFNSREALQQHLRTSSAPHPLCILCNRRFIDEIGYNSHMAAKHPPTYPCEPCSRAFTAQFALDDHYRGSSAHPNCGRCGKGFKDSIALDEHHATAHSPEAPKTPITASAATSPKFTTVPITTPASPDSPPSPAMNNVAKEESPAPLDPAPCPNDDVKPDHITTPTANTTALPDVDRPEESISKPPSPLVAATLKLPPSPPAQLVPELSPARPAGTTLTLSLSPIIEPLSPAIPSPLLHASSASASLPSGNPQSLTTNQMPSHPHGAHTPPRARNPALNNVLQIDSLRSQTGSPGLVLNQDFSSPLQEVQPPQYSSPGPSTPLWNAGHKPGHSSSGSWTSRDNIQSGPKVVPPLNLLARARAGPGLQRPFGPVATQQGPLNPNGGFQRWLNGVSRGSSGSPIDPSSPSVSRSNSRGKIFTLDPTPPNSSPFGSPGFAPLSRHPSQDSIVHDMGELYSTRSTNLRNSVIAGPLSPLQQTGSISQPLRSPTNSFKPGPSSLDLITFTTDKVAASGSAGGSMGSRRSSASSINRWTWNHEEVDITSALSSAASVAESPHKSKFGMMLNNPNRAQLSPDETSPIDLSQLPELSPFPTTPLGGGSSLFDSPRLSSSQIKMASQLGGVGIGKWLGDSPRVDGKLTGTIGGNISSSRVSPVPEESDIVMESQLGREREKEKERIKEARERSQSQSSVVTRKGKRNSLTNSVSAEPHKATKDDGDADGDVEDEKTKIQIDLCDLNADMATTLKKIDCEVFGREFDEDISDIGGDIGSMDLVAEVHKLKALMSPHEEQIASTSTSPQTAKPAVAHTDDAVKQEARAKQDAPVHKSLKNVLGDMNKLDSGSSTPLSLQLSPSSSIASYSKPTRNVLSPVTPPSDLEEETSQLSTSILSKKAKVDEFDLGTFKEDDDIHEEQSILMPDKALSRRPPLHCRICKIDRCQDTAATFCGHVFCYGCITQAIITNPSCPVCATPTLLYCVFRLDLAS